MCKNNMNVSSYIGYKRSLHQIVTKNSKVVNREEKSENTSIGDIPEYSENINWNDLYTMNAHFHEITHYKIARNQIENTSLYGKQTYNID